MLNGAGRYPEIIWSNHLSIILDLCLDTGIRKTEEFIVRNNGY
jgi:hypothetical protein